MAMDDYYQYIKQGNTAVRLTIWDTNKGPTLGYVKWQIDRLEDGLWVHCSSPVMTTFDVALRDGRSMLESVFNARRGM